MSVNLANTTADEDVLKNLNDVIGSRFDDTIVGNALNNWLVGGLGPTSSLGRTATTTSTSATVFRATTPSMVGLELPTSVS